MLAGKSGCGQPSEFLDRRDLGGHNRVSAPPPRDWAPGSKTTTTQPRLSRSEAVPDLAETAQGAASDNAALSHRTTPAGRGIAPATWEQFRGELGEDALPRDAQEVSAMNAIFNELMQPGIQADVVFDMVVESAASLTGAACPAAATWP